MKRYTIRLLMLMSVFATWAVPTVTASVPPSNVLATLEAVHSPAPSAEADATARDWSQGRSAFTATDLVMSLDLPALSALPPARLGVVEMLPAEQPLSPGAILVASSGKTRTDASAKALTVEQKSRYDRALALLWDGKPVEARSLLNDFLVDFPNSRLAPNALYWLGETYYSQQRYAQAILTFRDVMRRFPRHSKASASLLKIGYSYEKLGDMENARFYLKALLKDYPNSDPAALARTKLKQIEG